MRAVCRSNSPESLSEHQRGRFTSTGRWDLTPGAEYLVMGMGIWESIFSFLVRDDYGLPSWSPAGFFEFEEDVPFPSNWHFAFRDGIDLSGSDLWTHWVAQWGYERLILDPNHSDDLMDRVPEALELFHAEHERRSSLAQE
jgi:hypothetical protein